MGIKGEIAFGTIQERTYSALRSQAKVYVALALLTSRAVNAKFYLQSYDFFFFDKYEFFTIRICNKRTARYSVIALYFGRLDSCGLNNRTSILGVDKPFSALTPRAASCSVSNASCVWGMQSTVCAAGQDLVLVQTFKYIQWFTAAFAFALWSVACITCVTCITFTCPVLQPLAIRFFF